ncbi:DUF5004 domain-containing protein [Flavobacterium sp.]|jgi:hypothetical protein|uniref:DUF5004 domain-containing protein n=1 Tax=Flavobacterium sp. TaxID=239 RepID=UPI0022CB7E63|nr:DUF5004 domain-containing protein [Flavobacterium sp.]MCZ8091715.1 DUF5004 domain-containing protein [Flavobacterium sp.]
MKSKIFLFVFFIGITSAFSQTIDEKFVVGKWKVKKAIVTKNGENPEIMELLDGFQKATYIFNASHTFEFSTASKSKMIEQLANVFKKNEWYFDAKKKHLRVGHNDDNYSNIIFHIKIEDKKIIFTIEDTFIEMVMKKVK